MFSARLRSKNLFTGMGNFNTRDDKNLFRYSLIDQNSIALSHRSANFPLGFHGQNLAFSMRAGKKTAYELETQALIMSTITNGAKIKNKLIFLPVIYGSLLSRSPRMRFVMAHKGFLPMGALMPLLAIVLTILEASPIRADMRELRRVGICSWCQEAPEEIKD